MKPYRVKRGGKYIGSFLVVRSSDGRRINLGTKDASEARRRVELVKRGEWPPAQDAAAAVARALEGEGPPPVREEQSASPAAVTAQAAPAAPITESTPPKGNDGPPAPSSEGAQPPTAAGATAADAVNAAAAAAADDEDLDREAEQALAAAGIDVAEITANLPEWLGKAHLFLQGHVLRVPIRYVKNSWPPYVKVEGPEVDQLRVLLGKLWQRKLAAMNFDLEKLTPGWWLLIISGIVGIAQTTAMLDAMVPPGQAAPSPAVG